MVSKQQKPAVIDYFLGISCGMAVKLLLLFYLHYVGWCDCLYFTTLISRGLLQRLHYTVTWLFPFRFKSISIHTDGMIARALIMYSSLELQNIHLIFIILNSIAKSLRKMNSYCQKIGTSAPESFKSRNQCNNNFNDTCDLCTNI